jgi:hypothetical protein
VRQKKSLLALRFTQALAVADGYYQVGEAKSQSVKLLIILISLSISEDGILEGLLLLFGKIYVYLLRPFQQLVTSS